MSLRVDANISQLGPGPRILEQAHALVAAGLDIFPVFGVSDLTIRNGAGELCIERYECTCGRGASTADDHKPGKHPATTHGHLDARGWSDRDIARIWGDGDKNLAYRTGDGLVVIDVDEKNGGLDTLDEWEQWTGFSLPETLTALTGGGGRHLLYRYSPDLFRNPVTRPGVLPGIDIKGEGGYCIAPGSRHISGRMYEWVNPTVEISRPSPQLWDWLLGPGTGRGGHGGETPSGYDYTQGAVAGQRDAFFNDLAFRSRKEGLGWAEAMARQLNAWQNTEQPEGDHYPWTAAYSKLERVWSRVQPDPDVGAARDVLRRWNAARETGNADRFGNRTIIARNNSNGETL